MIREEYLRRLVDAAHVDLYLSGTDGARIYWPWRMQPTHEASDRYRNACESYVVDSAPQREDITTEDTLDVAHRVDAEVASLADVYQDKPATVNSLLEGISIADDHSFDGTLLLPLQKPFVECWREIGSPTDNVWLGIGGLKDASDAARIGAAEDLRAAVDDAHIHGFGWGPSGDLAAAIRDTPSLLDSLDYSTPVRSTPVDHSSGEERMSVAAAYAGARLVRDLREVTPFPDHDDSPQRAQAGVADF